MELTVAWIKGIHVAALVVWGAGLLYLPGLFATHCDARHEDVRSFHRLRAMTRLTFIGVTSPAAVLAVLSGSALVGLRDISGGWLPLKLTAVTGIVAYHAYCGYLLARLREEHSYRPRALLSLMLVPAALISTVLWLVLAKPI
jgi:putative membrane protein